ncbi:Thiol-disulfide oxidoreductase ResA [Bacteroides pyogenes]|jgi:peroxiredoxin|uniref:redoxin family protein n=1 Tax=Bacteroides pyogenes TaxID=310300 RepID=UPI0003F9FE7E|nr:redoxin family protein [Bacteroides pyogenes]MBR8719399.1 Thiol-disulfide oxidoreductase ResA [Bacteroides pyogenes]MBR8724356.1 Thiol-disulfide oxidoreductase ResA [Bacteroides pyogenes]MBR8737795.1 Thiol-disulfide oxidoreductase ResA [Bacteroides pyogenes]MBR8753432.1 Thiol-disulfide oxidoreductase ResA [Bacteroides pyogenes]MBR8786316.1 Thiol-disulfide oxidoreductase ResA [Bacteroides pyogenes]
MRKGIIIAVLLCLSNIYLIYAQHSLVIRGQIEGVDAGRLYLLVQTAEYKVDTLGAASFQAPDFVLKGCLSEPVVAQIVLEGYQGGFTFLAEPDTDYRALLKNEDGAFIRGGKLQDEWTAYVERSNSLFARIDSLRERYNMFRQQNKYRSASALNDTLKIVEERYEQEKKQFLSAHDDLIAAYMVQMDAMKSDMDIEGLRRLYDSLGEGAKNTLSARIMKERIDRLEKTEKGRLAPDFTLPDMGGRMVTLSKTQAKIKILDFWASWCGPCRLNNPALKKLYAEYHGKGLEIIGVSLDNKRERWEDAVSKDGLPWINVSSLKGWGCVVARQYNVAAIPALFVLDEKNRIIATHLRGEKLHSFLKERLK